ncbi:hypothetical protein SDC9_103794 [bioreactor metagenome]|uniref:Uncharacterized protein n=1 Tax=bioreactor metagenome TaxID=1076179 RepID=A0A645AV31_9ZZZZ
MKSLLRFPQCGPLRLDLQPVCRVAVSLRVLVCQTADNGGGKADVGHSQKGAAAIADGLPQFFLRKGDPDLKALTHLRKVGRPPGGIFRRVAGQQQQPHIPCPGCGLHRLLADLQHSGPLAQAQRGQ